MPRIKAFEINGDCGVFVKTGNCSFAVKVKVNNLDGAIEDATYIVDGVAKEQNITLYDTEAKHWASTEYGNNLMKHYAVQAIQYHTFGGVSRVCEISELKKARRVRTLCRE